MKVEKLINPEVFKPITIQITIETPEEYDCLSNMHNSVHDMASSLTYYHDEAFATKFIKEVFKALSK